VRKRGRPRTKRCSYEEAREVMCEDNESVEDDEFDDSDS
jgi:hypothetical protein